MGLTIRAGLIVSVIVLLGMVAVSEAAWCQCTGQVWGGREPDNEKTRACCAAMGKPMTTGWNGLSHYCDAGPNAASSSFPKCCASKGKRGDCS